MIIPIILLASLAHSLPVEITVNNFETLLGAPLRNYKNPTHQHWFIMFHSPTCGHCKKFKPTFMQMADEIPKYRFGLVDCAAEAEICGEFQIFSYPTLMLIKELDQVYVFRNKQRNKKNIVEFLQNPGPIRDKTQDPSWSTIVWASATNGWKQILAACVIIPAIFAYFFSKFMDRYLEKKKQEKEREKKKDKQSDNDKEGEKSKLQ